MSDRDGGGLEEDAAGWFDEADGELDRFLEEEALIEALQTEADGLLQEEDGPLSRMQPFEVDNPSWPLVRAVGSTASATWDAGTLASSVESLAASVNETLGLQSREGGKERSLNDTAVGPEGTRLLRQQEALGSPSGGTTRSSAASSNLKSPSGNQRPGPGRQSAKPKPIPWGALALFVVVVFSICYVTTGLFEGGSEIPDSVAGARTQIAAAEYAKPRPISLPRGDLEDHRAARGQLPNATFGVHSGRISVQKSREVAASGSGVVAEPTFPDQQGPNATAPAAVGDEGGATASGGSSSSDPVPPPRIGRRKGLRGVDGDSEGGLR